MTPGNFNMPPVRRGNTTQAMRIIDSLSLGGVPVGIAAATLKVFAQNNPTDIIKQWVAPGNEQMMIMDGGVLLARLPSDVTASLRPGRHRYSLTIATDNGDVWTVLEGTFPVEG